MAEHQSINFHVGRDVSGVTNLGVINGDVSNAINQLQVESEPSKTDLMTLLMELQAVIQSETELPADAKVEALEQVKTLAEAGQNPDDNAMQKAAKTAMKILKGTTAGLAETTKLALECGKLLPAIATLLSII